MFIFVQKNLKRKYELRFKKYISKTKNFNLIKKYIKSCNK